MFFHTNPDTSEGVGGLVWVITPQIGLHTLKMHRMVALSGVVAECLGSIKLSCPVVRQRRTSPACFLSSSVCAMCTCSLRVCKGSLVCFHLVERAERRRLDVVRIS